MKALATCLLIFALWEAHAFSSGTVGQTTTQEVVTKDAPAIFTAKTNLVMVPVVVRDKKGKAVGTLRQEGFQLFDKGKPQVISRFSVEKSGAGKVIAAVRAPGAPNEKGGAPPVIAPDRFVGLLFDDIHTNFADLAMARAGAQKFLASSLKSTDRAAIFTTSGQTTLDFTDDRDLLNKTLLKLVPRPREIASIDPETCPPSISLFPADLMINGHDREAIAVAVGDVEKCNPGIGLEIATVMALGHARVVLEEGREQTNATIVSLKEVVGKMAEMPGQRTLILASPGFIFLGDQFRDEGPVIDLAIRSGVVINALDVKGVVNYWWQHSAAKARLLRDAGLATSGTLDDLAYGTGGKAYHLNFPAEGFKELGAAPEVFYLLGFSPQNLKLDGAFHALKVSPKTSAGMSVQARRGYYAPDHLASAEEDAKKEVTQALFSREEVGEIPVVTNTEFFKASQSEARLSVTSRIDVRRLRFRQADGRNLDDLRVVCALFDRNGNFVQASTKIVQMRLLDDTLQNNKLSGGIPVILDFTVAPGAYVIRLVVRDAEGQTMTAQNSAVKIP
jgi:VWFA-related protein